VHATTDPTGEIRAEVATRLDELTTALTAHGFSVLVERKFWLLTATHQADKLAPKRSRQVQLATDENVRLHWYWTPSRTASVQRLCPAAAIAEATEHIAHALRSAAHR
jgi:hypothetical protein